MLASCNDPGLLARGKRIGNDFSHGQMVTYACTAQGYNLVGNPQLTCNDSKWDLARPECKGYYSRSLYRYFRLDSGNYVLGDPGEVSRGDTE